MKKTIPLLLLGLLSTPAVSHAQSYDKAHQLSASELKISDWPRYKKDVEAERSSNVMALQYLLRNRGVYKSKIDGIFGDSTEAAVRKFQRAKGLNADGVVGPQTWPVLLLRLKKGDKGDAVRALQILLRSFEGSQSQMPFITQEIDGVFGASTEKNVRTYQRDTYGKKLKVDGIVGARTWNNFFGLGSDAGSD